MERLQPPSEEDTQAVCSQWLSQTAGSAQGAILHLLQACRDASELAAAEAKLRTAIQDWKHAPQTGSLRALGARPGLCFGRPHPWRLGSLHARHCDALPAFCAPPWLETVLEGLALEAGKLATRP